MFVALSFYVVRVPIPENTRLSENSENTKGEMTTEEKRDNIVCQFYANGEPGAPTGAFSPQSPNPDFQPWRLRKAFPLTFFKRMGRKARNGDNWKICGKGKDRGDTWTLRDRSIHVKGRRRGGRFSENPSFSLGGDGSSGGSVVCTIGGKQYLAATYFGGLKACETHGADVHIESYLLPTGEILENIPAHHFKLHNSGSPLRRRSG